MIGAAKSRTLPGLCRRADRWVIRQVLLFGLAAIVSAELCSFNLSENQIYGLWLWPWGFISSAIVHRFVLPLDMLDADIRNGIDIYTVAAGLDLSLTS